MRKIKKMVLGAVTAACVGGAAMLAGGTVSLAVTEEYKSALEEAYGDTFHRANDNQVAGSPLETEVADGVDTATGHLMLSRTDLSLEGTGGMDFELSRYYDSNEADLGHTTVEYVDELELDTVWVNYTAEDGGTRRIIVSTAVLEKHKNALKNLVATYTVGDVRRGEDEDGNPKTTDSTQRTKVVSSRGYDVYGVASGWRFDFPWIETVALAESEDWSERPAYLHWGSAGVMAIETSADSSAKAYSITGLDYDYEDVELQDWVGTVDGIPVRYLLRDKTGLRTYFNADGVVVLQKDAHDNSVTFTYTAEGIYFKKITDSVGREIVFHYSGSGDEKVLSSVTVKGEETEGGVTSKTVTYETEEKNYMPLNGESLSGFILTAATVDGSRETYGYKTAEKLVNTSGAGVASQRVSTNQSFLLTKAAADGGETHYEYRACSVRGAKGSNADQTRDAITEQFYVTREYEKDLSTGKKSNGVKYDYFQKKGGTLFSFADFREYESANKIKYELSPYGTSGLQTVTVVSSFNPNKYKTNGKYYDYKYKKSKINADTLHLSKETKKNVDLYIYNEDKLLTEEVNYGKEKEETINSYTGSLLALEITKSYGKKGSKAIITKHGYTYDNYRNVLTSIGPKAYLKKNSGREHLFTTVYTYHQTDKGYPEEDTAYSLCTLLTQESYTSVNTKSRMTGSVAANGVDYASVFQLRSVGGGVYKTITKTDFVYDEHGNEIQGKVYPSYGTDGIKEVIQNDYTFNSLGQQTKKSVTVTSAKRPQDSRTYTEEEVTYDSFGNELTYTDENGLVSKTTYDPETGEEAESVEAVGTEYESQNNEYVSADGLKTMTVDNYGRVSINIQDGFGNTIISKDEAAGTWTESVYEYGSVDEDGDGSGSGEDDEDEDSASGTGKEKEETALLIEERTYSFVPDEKRFITNENGEKVANFYISGRGDDILSGSKHFYDDLGNEVGSAEFSNGELDSAHCTSWSFTKSESEVIAEDDDGDDAITTTTSYSKELNPADYQSAADADNYYNQFDGSILSETVTESVSDAEGNTLSQTSTTTRGKNKSQTVTTYESDDFEEFTKKK